MSLGGVLIDGRGIAAMSCVPATDATHIWSQVTPPLKAAPGKLSCHTTEPVKASRARTSDGCVGPGFAADGVRVDTDEDQAVSAKSAVADSGGVGVQAAARPV